jgi:hypothetical protein
MIALMTAAATLTATAMAQEITTLVVTKGVADYCTETRLARALIAVREWAGLPLDDDLTALGCGWWRMEGDSLTLYQDTEWAGRWATVERSGRDAFVVRSSRGRQVYADCYESAHDIAREIVEDWAGWQRA